MQRGTKSREVDQINFSYVGLHWLGYPITNCAHAMHMHFTQSAVSRYEISNELKIIYMPNLYQQFKLVLGKSRDGHTERHVYVYFEFEIAREYEYFMRFWQLGSGR